MLDKLNSVEKRYTELSTALADPVVQGDAAEYRRQAKALSEIEPLVEKYREYRAVQDELAQAQELAKSPDAEMRALAQEELQALESRRETIERDLRILLVPKDPNDEKNVLLEIRAGTGGDEAALFAGELYRMYTRYAERQGWKLDLMSLSETGIGGHQGSHPVDRRQAGVQPAEVRERRPPGAARAGHRGERAHSHVHRHRRSPP